MNSKSYFNRLLVLIITLLSFHNSILSQSTEELFSLPGLRFGIDVTDDIGSLSNNSIFYRKDTTYEGKYDSK